MARIPRHEILKKLRAKVRRGEPIIGGGAGTGLSAKCEEAGGIDLIVIYNSGRYRMAGRGSLAGLMAYGNANEIVVDMAREVLPVVKAHAGARRRQRHRPVHDPRPFPARSSRALGFSGVQNFPTVGLFDGVIRAQLEETGMGYGARSRHDPRARELDLLTTPYVFSEHDARGDGEGGRRHHRLPSGPDHRRRDRRRDRAEAEGLRAADRALGGSGARGQSATCSCLPRRADRDARGRALHPEELPGLQRLLRRLQHGAPADRNRNH